MTPRLKDHNPTIKSSYSLNDGKKKKGFCYVAYSERPKRVCLYSDNGDSSIEVFLEVKSLIRALKANGLV